MGVPGVDEQEGQPITGLFFLAARGKFPDPTAVAFCFAFISRIIFVREKK